jgi:hypothetical protein
LIIKHEDQKVYEKSNESIEMEIKKFEKGSISDN